MIFKGPGTRDQGPGTRDQGPGTRDQKKLHNKKTIILIDIKKYLREKQTATLQELAWHFKRDPEMMRQLLSHWIQKGVIVRAKTPAGCGTRCVQCKPEYAEVYQFQEIQRSATQAMAVAIA